MTDGLRANPIGTVSLSKHWLHVSGQAEPDRVLQRPARIGAFRTGGNQQLGHALVRTVLRGCPLDGGPVELHRVRGAVPMCRRLRGGRHIQTRQGLLQVVAQPARPGVRLDRVSACGGLGLGHRSSLLRVLLDRVRCRLGVELTKGPAPSSLGLLPAQRSGRGSFR